MSVRRFFVTTFFAAVASGLPVGAGPVGADNALAAEPPPLREGRAPERAPEKLTVPAPAIAVGDLPVAQTPEKPAAQQSSPPTKAPGAPAPAGFRDIPITSVGPAREPTPVVKPKATGATPAAFRASAPPSPASHTSAQGATPAAGVFVQLGAYSSADFAVEMWDRKRAADPDALAGRTPVYVARDRKSDGKTLHLLRVGPLPAAQADALCASLKDECLIVAR